LSVSSATADPENQGFSTRFFGVFRYSRRAIDLVWTTSRRLTVILAILTLVVGVLPAVVAYVGQLIVDGVVAAIAQRADVGVATPTDVLVLVAVEAAVVIVIAGGQRGISVCESLLRALLGHRVNVMILEKALTLQLANFEDSEFYDRLTRARREASSR
jgi:ATP-binding cassette subfamily B protein